jgi:hypothetical protein
MLLATVSPHSSHHFPLATPLIAVLFCSSNNLHANHVSVTFQVLTALLLNIQVFQEVKLSTWYNAPAYLNLQTQSMLTLSEGTIITRLNIGFLFIF